VNLEERQQIEVRVTQLNDKLTTLGISQLSFHFDIEGEVVQLLYKLSSCNFYEWIGSVVDSTPSEILDWLKVQESQFYLYKQLISYFGSGFAHAIIPNDSTVTLTLSHLTYVFSYDREHLVIFAYKNYIGKDLAKSGSKLGELKLERLGMPHSREPLGTKVSMTRVCPETEVVKHLDYIISTFKQFEEMVVNQSN
jgi:hypothetical protein